MPNDLELESPFEHLRKPGEVSKWPKKPQYYAKPDGEDLFGKVLATNRYAFLIGATAGLQDVVLYSKHLKGFQPNMGRVLFYVIPIVGMANAWTFTTFASTRFRGKDDKINYVWGGYAAGGVAGMFIYVFHLLLSTFTIALSYQVCG